MPLKELKKEVDSLADLNQSLVKFKKTWLRQIKPGTNRSFPFLQELDSHLKKEINQLLASRQPFFNRLKYAQFINEKLSSLAQYLIELKLTSLNGDTQKPKMLLNKFLRDDFLNLKNMVDEVREFELALNRFQQTYHQINQVLARNLPLEHSLAFLAASHNEHLNTLRLTARQQKVLLRRLGAEFISLTRTMKKEKKL